MKPKDAEILALLEEWPEVWFTTSQIAEHLGTKVTVIASRLDSMGRREILRNRKIDNPSEKGGHRQINVWAAALGQLDLPHWGYLQTSATGALEASDG